MDLVKYELREERERGTELGFFLSDLFIFFKLMNILTISDV